VNGPRPIWVVFRPLSRLRLLVSKDPAREAAPAPPPAPNWERLLN